MQFDDALLFFLCVCDDSTGQGHVRAKNAEESTHQPHPEVAKIRAR